MTRRASGAADGQLAFDLPGFVEPRAAVVPELLDPAEVARRCGLSYAPSPEQAAVVQAPVDRPMVVVAGAGSGKTETMAARVAWLVANQLVAPEAVLGLTFTRKAASELGARIRLRLTALAAHPDTDQALRERLEVASPTVATYHGYAAGIVAEHGLRIGVEPGAGVLGPAMCWGQAATAVAAHTGDMSDVALGLVTTTEDVLQLAAELGEHDIAPDRLRSWTSRLEAQMYAYPVTGRTKGPYADVLKMLARQRSRVALLPMVEAFEARKRAAGAIDYADQVAYAARAATSSPEVGRRERARWRVVLLDEYQDTSVGQLRMLEALFGGDAHHPVLAVGDPRQSIYGWRGASSGTIERFPRTFPGAPDRPAQRLTLSTSWRNDQAVLAVANRVAADLPQPADAAPLPDLTAAPTAGPGEVRVGLYETVAEETAALADRLAAQWHGRPGDDGAPPAGRPTIAVLARRRAQLPGIAAAMRERGLPVEVVGLGGLLDVPEVSDVVATLTVLVDPTAGDALGRLLTGARWRIGPRDLAALEARARHLVRGRRPGPDGPAADTVTAPTEGAAGSSSPPSGAASSRPSTTWVRRPPTPPTGTAGCAGWAPSSACCAAGWASRCPTWSTRWSARWVWRPSWPATPTPAPAAPAPTWTPCTPSPRSSPTWPSCRRCRRSWATWPMPRCASAAWSPARSRSTRRRCSC
ncbi:ATP-dependent helicase [Klenkia terrae]|uniref:ATP-dependent helicase n=1 Tax=Klenkia terrae TaxID=1052259 RepID=UPI00361BB959